MSADDGGIRATQDKERGQEVPTGCWEGEACAGRIGVGGDFQGRASERVRLSEGARLVDGFRGVEEKE